MAIFKWSNKMYMSEEEIKNLTDEQKLIKKTPKPIDLSKAERVIINKSDLKV